MGSRVIVSLLVAALMVLAGCNSGGDDTTDQAKNGEKKGQKKDKGQKKKKKDPKSCENRGINPREGKTGTCNVNGKPVVVVNRDDTLVLKELDVKVGKVSGATSLNGPAGAVPAAKGKVFITAQLRVKNKTSKAEQFDEKFKQVRLRVAGAGFPGNEKGEGVVKNSFFNQNRKIPPGKTQTAAVVFQGKAGIDKALRQRGADPSILIWNFSDEAGKSPPNGTIRLWK